MLGTFASRFGQTIRRRTNWPSASTGGFTANAGLGYLLIWLEGVL